MSKHNQDRSPEEQRILEEVREAKGRELTRSEENLSLAQAYRIGELTEEPTYHTDPEEDAGDR